MYRIKREGLEVFLVHPGGPYWAKKYEGSWSIPKGEYEEGEPALEAACREFTEETSFIPQAPFLELGMVRQKSGKVVTAWAFEGNADADQLVSNTCQIEWPPRSGRHIIIAEVDRGAWFTLHDAHPAIRQEQQLFLARLENLLDEQ